MYKHRILGGKQPQWLPFRFFFHFRCCSVRSFSAFFPDSIQCSLIWMPKWAHKTKWDKRKIWIKNLVSVRRRRRRRQQWIRLHRPRGRWARYAKPIHRSIKKTLINPSICFRSRAFFGTSQCTPTDFLNTKFDCGPSICFQLFGETRLSTSSTIIFRKKINFIKYHGNIDSS